MLYCCRVSDPSTTEGSPGSVLICCGVSQGCPKNDFQNPRRQSLKSCSVAKSYEEVCRRNLRDPQRQRGTFCSVAGLHEDVSRNIQRIYDNAVLTQSLTGMFEGCAFAIHVATDKLHPFGDSSSPTHDNVLAQLAAALLRCLGQRIP